MSLYLSTIIVYNDETKNPASLIGGQEERCRAGLWRMELTRQVYLDLWTEVNHNKGMATRAQIEQLRIAVNDPADVLHIVDVDSDGDIPSPAAKQTAYYVDIDGVYYYEGEVADLNISDAVIERLIDSLGYDKAVCRALALITRRLGAQLGVVRSQVGTDTTEYQSLRDMYTYYKDLSDTCKEQNREDANNSTGRLASYKQPDIAGGNL